LGLRRLTPGAKKGESGRVGLGREGKGSRSRQKKKKEGGKFD